VHFERRWKHGFQCLNEVISIQETTLDEYCELCFTNCPASSFGFGYLANPLQIPKNINNGDNFKRPLGNEAKKPLQNSSERK